MNAETENGHRPDIVLPSDRKFGVYFTVIFLVVAGYLLFRATSTPAAIAAAVVAAGFAIATWLRPAVLGPLNRGWSKVGLLLGRIVSPVVLGLIFFGLVTPVAFVSRVFGRDEMRLKKRAGASSYWIDRQPPGPAPDSFKNPY